MKKTAEKTTDVGFEDWNALADSTVIQIRGLKLQLRVAEALLHLARMNRDNLRPKETPKTPDTATDDVKTHAKQL